MYTIKKWTELGGEHVDVLEFNSDIDAISYTNNLTETTGIEHTVEVKTETGSRCLILIEENE